MKTKINYLLVLVLAGFVLTGCCSMKHCGNFEVQQWEYKIVTLYNHNSNDVPAKLNELGKEGWMLITVEPVDYQGGQPASVYGSDYFFKRPKQ